MLGRHTLVAVGLAASVGVPYLSHSTDKLADNASRWWNSSDQGSYQRAPQGHGPQHSPAAAVSPHALPAEGTLPAWEGIPPQDLAEIFNFNATVPWLMSRWPRVSAGLAELETQGYRVPLVTGTRQDDLAGSLTYYFDKEQRVERIVFHGTTGDPRRLLALVSSQYRLARQPTNDPTLQLYQFKWNGKPHSELRIRPARIVRADAPYSRFELELLLKRV